MGTIGESLDRWDRFLLDCGYVHEHDLKHPFIKGTYVLVPKWATPIFVHAPTHDVRVDIFNYVKDKPMAQVMMVSDPAIVINLISETLYGRQAT